MADLQTCGIGALDWNSIVRNILGAAAETPSVCNLRVFAATGDVTRVIKCGDTGYSLDELQRAVIGIAPDGKPGIRVVITEYSDGRGLEDYCQGCLQHDNIDNLLKPIFVEFANGEIAIAIALITTAPL